MNTLQEQAQAYVDKNKHIDGWVMQMITYYTELCYVKVLVNGEFVEDPDQPYRRRNFSQYSLEVLSCLQAHKKKVG